MRAVLGPHLLAAAIGSTQKKPGAILIDQRGEDIPEVLCPDSLEAAIHLAAAIIWLN
jgi:hypothetical protein